MNLGILFSGGKDSFLALWRAKEAGHTISCLISIRSENPESYMFHVPNIHLAPLHAEALGIPLVEIVTKGEKESELIDLKKALQEAMTTYHIAGVVTGAIASTYQASRVQRICAELDLWCFNPLWLRDQESILQEVLTREIDAIIVGVFAYPLDASWLGRKIDTQCVADLMVFAKKFKMNPAGEGGEIETMVLNSPLHKKKIVIKEHKKSYDNHSGVFMIRHAEVMQK